MSDLLAQVTAEDGSVSVLADLGARSERLREARARHRADHERWQRLVHAFALDPLDEEVLLLALAPQLDLRYETLFAYLNDDVAHKWPTVDLALGVPAATPPGTGAAAATPAAGAPVSERPDPVGRRRTHPALVARARLPPRGGRHPSPARRRRPNCYC